MSKLKETVLALEKYCEDNPGSILLLSALQKDAFKDCKLRTLKRAARSLKRRKIITLVFGELFYVGKSLPTNINDLIISFYDELYPRDLMRVSNQKTNDEKSVLYQYEIDKDSSGEADYFTKKRIRRINQVRELSKPRTNMFAMVVYTLLSFAGIATIWICVFLIPIRVEFRIVVALLTTLLFLDFYLRFYFIQMIKCYQHYATEETRRKCICIPSCSEYSIYVLKKYELIVSLFKIRKRLFKTCRGENCLIDLPYSHK